MGLPQILIEFKEKAQTAVVRSQNGIVAAVLLDTTKTGAANASYSYNYEAEVNTGDWTGVNRDYLNKIFMGAPKRVLVERIEAADGYADALARLKNKTWNWLTVPGIEKHVGDVKTTMDWIIAQRAAKKTFKAVLAVSAKQGLSVNDEGIVDFATDGIKVGTKTYTHHEYCCRIAGLLAGLSMTESATYQVLSEIESITETTTPDIDIDAGKFILINDGEKIKVGRGINSLHVLSGSKTEDMKKIKIIEGMDLMRDDIRTTFEQNYIGINNSYDNKVMFVAAINQYFDELTREGILYDEYDNAAAIDVDATRSYLIEHSYDVSEMSEDDIKKARTGSWVFVNASVQFSDAIEDLNFTINME